MSRLASGGRAILIRESVKCENHGERGWSPVKTARSEGDVTFSQL